MFEPLTPIVDAFKAHAYGSCALFVLILILNAAFRIKTPAEWVVVLDRFPRVHALMDVVRFAGIQPVELVGAIARLASGKWPKDPPVVTPGSGPPVPGAGDGPTLPGATLGQPQPFKNRALYASCGAFHFAFAAALCAALASLSCDGLKGPASPDQVAQDVNRGLSDADKLCVVSNAIFPNETIRKVCNLVQPIEALTSIIELLATPHRREVALAREKGHDEGIAAAKLTGVCR